MLENKKIYSEQLFDRSAELVSDLNLELVGTTLTHKVFGVGTVDFVDKVEFRIDNSAYLTAKISFADETKLMAIDFITQKFFTGLPEEVLTLLIALNTEYTKLTNKRNQEAMQAELERKEREKEEVRLAKLTAAAIKKAQSLKAESSKVHKTYGSNWYYTLGWLAKNVSTLRASLPDTLHNWFDSIFGADTERYEVDHTLKTSGGFSYQWGVSMKATLKKSKDEAPLYLQNIIKKKEINDTAFVYTLVDRYGFKFGKEQDLDTIIDNIPVDHLEEFKLGLAA